LNPRTIQWQSAVTGAVIVVLAAIEDARIAGWIALTGLLATPFLNATYAHALGARGRPARRRHGDRLVATYVAAAFLLPLVVACAIRAVGRDAAVAVWWFTPQEVDALLTGLAVMFAMILLSSLVDWYYVRPRIDGVVWSDPPCRSSGQARWKRVTRRWYLHRGLASLSYSAYALLVSLIIMLMLVRRDNEVAGIIGGVSGIATVLLIVVRNHWDQVRTVAGFVLSPAFSLGDDLAYDTYRRRGRGFVLHVAVPVAKLVPLDDHGAPVPGAKPVERKNSDLADGDLAAAVTHACHAACARLNPECVIGEPRVDPRRRLLVLW
jgi:hypothetical protein